MQKHSECRVPREGAFYPSGSPGQIRSVPLRWDRLPLLPDPSVQTPSPVPGNPESEPRRSLAEPGGKFFPFFHPPFCWQQQFPRLTLRLPQFTSQFYRRVADLTLPPALGTF